MVSHVGVHESIEAVFPPSMLVNELSDVEPAVGIVSESDLEECDALVTFDYEPAFLTSGLEWVHSVQAGVDKFPLEEFESAGVALTNSTGIHGTTVGETVLGYMLSFARGLHTYRSNQERRTWERMSWDRPFTLDGESICVVGLGTLGRGIAARADAVGMAVTGVKRTPTPVDGVDEVYPSRELEAAIEDVRFVVLTVPLTDETRGLVGADEFAAMRDDAYLVNVARGPVVDETALIEALEDGEIEGAALDVFETEPLPAESPLWEMDEVIVTPHFAAATRDYYRHIGTLVRENVTRLAAGESLANRVV